MNYSFGDNKRKPGGCSSSVTETKRRHTLAQTWVFPSKQRKVPSEAVIPSVMARNAGNQSWFNERNNGSLPYYPCLDALTSLFGPLTISDWTLNGDAVQSANTIQLVPAITIKKGSAFYNTAIDPTFPFRINAEVSLGAGSGTLADGFTIALVNNLNYLGGGGGGCGFVPRSSITDNGFALRINTHTVNTATFLDIDGNVYATGSLTNTVSTIKTSGAFVQLDYDGVTLVATITSIIDPTKVDTLECKLLFRNIFGAQRCYIGSTAATGGSSQLTALTSLSYTPIVNPLCTPLPDPYYIQGWRFAGFDFDGTSLPPAILASPAPLPTYDAISTWGGQNDTILTNLGVVNGIGGVIVPSQTNKSNRGVFFSGMFRAPYSGSYVFKALTDDGLEMYVNGTKVFNSPYEQASTLTSGGVTLSAGGYYVVSGLWTNRTGGLQFSFTDILVNGSSVWTPTLFQNSIYNQNDGNPAVLPGLNSGLRYATYDNPSSPVIDNPATWGTRDDTLITTLNIPGPIDGQIVPLTGATTIALYFTGYFRAPISGSYVFNINSDDGIQIDMWTGDYVPSTRTQNTGVWTALIDRPNTTTGDLDTNAITLVAGKYYPIRGLFAQGGGPGNFYVQNMKVNGNSIMGSGAGKYTFYSCLYK